MQYLLGIDNGGTFVKAALFDAQGQQLAVEAAATPAEHLDLVCAERDLDLLWQINAQVIKGCILAAGIAAEEIAGVSFSGHGKGLYLLDKAGMPLGRGIMSTDGRAEAVVKRWQDSGQAERLYTKTYQKLIPSQSPALLMWLKEQAAETFAQIGTVFAVKDYIRYRLTGNVHAEYSDASGNNLLNLQTRSYDPEILSLFGLEELEAAFPPLLNSFELAGVVSPEAAEQCGLLAGTPVAAGMFDINACGLASGLTNEDELAVIAGTWSINEYISKQLITDGSIALNSLYCMDGYYLHEESSATSAGNLEWYLKNVLNFANEAHALNYQEINAWVASVEPGTSDMLFLPFINGSADTALAKASFIGLHAGSALPQLLRAIYEGVVFTHKAHIDRLLQNRPKPERIRLSGGAGKSAEWVQIFADVLQTPIEVVQDIEIGCLGAAMAAGLAIGMYKDYEDAVVQCLKLSRRTEPQPQHAAYYEKQYARYVRLRSLLNEFWPDKA